MPRKNTEKSDWLWVCLKEKERAEQGKKTTFTFNDREYSEATLSKEIGRKGIGTELIFNSK
jgi:hypothetical protein